MTSLIEKITNILFSFFIVLVIITLSTIIFVYFDSKGEKHYENITPVLSVMKNNYCYSIFEIGDHFFGRKEKEKCTNSIKIHFGNYTGYPYFNNNLTEYGFKKE